MTREAFLEALVQRVEAAWGDMDAPVSMADAFTITMRLTELGREVWRMPLWRVTYPEDSELPAETAEPARDDEPTLF